ncbi:MAG TPA: hypothetical protein VN034_09920 [Sphingopyxis sp.]|nr:hypothetical protein [Sphingopyxis sp.]
MQALSLHGLAVVGALAVPTALLLALWESVGTALPVAWWTWLARRLPDDAEADGGLMVAVVQLAITLGTAGDDLLFDAGGHRATFIASVALLAASALLAVFDARRANSDLHPERTR